MIIYSNVPDDGPVVERANEMERLRIFLESLRQSTQWCNREIFSFVQNAKKQDTKEKYPARAVRLASFVRLQKCRLAYIIVAEKMLPDPEISWIDPRLETRTRWLVALNHIPAIECTEFNNPLKL